MSETFERIRMLMAGEFQLDPEQITPQTQLVELGVDSLAALEFVFLLEDAFHLTMDAATDLRGGLVQDVVNAVDRALMCRATAVAAL